MHKLRPLNKRTIPDRYPLPNINEMLSSFWGSKWFTVIDLASAYWQIQLRKKDRPKTAFLTRNRQYQFKVMPFRLNNALATFQRLMNKVLRQYIGKFVQVYLDDVIIYSNNLTEHKKHIKAVLEKIREANLKLKPSKCQWFQTELKFVGHLVGRNGIRPDPRNVEKIKDAEVPKNTTELRRFLGMAQYYRQYINGYADKAGPLYDMLKAEGPAVWRQAQEEGKERVIAYEARRLSVPERNYPTTEKECLAVVWAIQKFKQYLGGWIPFTVYTDHAALKTLIKHDNPTPRRARWMEVLATYFFEIKHRSGKKMDYADYLSRINQTNPEYPWDRKDAKYVLNILYNDKGVYGSERYKDPMEGLIQ